MDSYPFTVYFLHQSQSGHVSFNRSRTSRYAQYQPQHLHRSSILCHLLGIYDIYIVCDWYHVPHHLYQNQTNPTSDLTPIRAQRKERTEELNQVKLRFFTNISHEFRTPLTLIIGQIEVLLQSNKLAPTIYNRILHIYKNAWHMRDLISELLDFRKQEQGYLKLKIEHKDIVPL